MRQMLIFLIMVGLLVGPALATEMTGRVVDASGAPIPAATIVTDLPTVGTIADPDGNFRLILPTDELSGQISRLTFSSVGYQSRQFLLADVPETIVLKQRYYQTGGILVTAERAVAGVTPAAFANVSQEQIERDHTVGEFPLLLETTPNLFAFSDGGAPLGYSYTAIRGFDDKRIATYINGVPLNDPEDQATYFVDLPDFAANATDIQVQRGVGNSLYGDASFGGSINVATSAFSAKRSLKLTSGYGEFTSGGKSVSDIYKQSVAYSSGLIDGRWHFDGRYSRQRTGGFREHSWYNGWSYYFAIGRIDPKMTTELYVYGGPIQMHLSYWGASRDKINENRRYNPLDYRNETDNFNQPHYHLHNRYQLSEQATLTNTLYYIRGKGYYEQFKEGRAFAEYAIDPSQIEIDPDTTIPYEEGDLVRQQWVKKNQVGWNPRLDITHESGRHTVGGSFYTFDSDHWGQVVWAQHIAGELDPRHVYYQYAGRKQLGSLYAQEFYRFDDQWSTQVTAQLRFQQYDFKQQQNAAFLGHEYDNSWLFFSPRLGVNFAATEQVNLFSNFAVSSRTPTDASIYDANDPSILPSLEILSVNTDSTVYEFGDPLAKNERVYNLELGGTYSSSRYAFELNFFWMDFRNEIIPEGGINENTGLPITVNADRSVHAGIELAGTFKATSSLTFSSNFAYNYNRVKEYTAMVDLYDANFVPQGLVEVDYADKILSGFPVYLGNFITEFHRGDWRVTNRVRLVGRRYMDLWNIERLSLAPYATASLSVEYSIGNFLQVGRLSLQGRIDNLFDKKYETSGYGGNYAIGSADTIDGWAEYYVAAERSFYTQLSLEMF